MAGDLISLRMLVVAAASPRHELWLKAVARATVPIELQMLDVAPAATLLSRARTDVFILDADLSDANKSILIKAARAAPPAPLIFMTGPQDASRPEGIDGVVARPGSEEEADNLVRL